MSQTILPELLQKAAYPGRDSATQAGLESVTEHTEAQMAAVSLQGSARERRLHGQQLEASTMLALCIGENTHVSTHTHTHTHTQNTKDKAVLPSFPTGLEFPISEQNGVFLSVQRILIS